MSKYLDIIGVLINNLDNPINGREIARLLSVSPQTALNQLNQILKEGIIGRGNLEGIVNIIF